MQVKLSVLAVLPALVFPQSNPPEARPVSARAQPSADSMRAHDEVPAVIRPENAEAYARQQDFDARIARKTREVARSVCQGCASDGRPRKGGRAADAEESALQNDPAQAPLD